MLNALGSASPKAYGAALPILDYALRVESSEATNLLEDGLALWLVLLRNAPADAAGDALRLWPRWVAVMAAGIEHIPLCMPLASSAVLLGGAEFLQARGHASARHAKSCAAASVDEPWPGRW